MIFTLPQISEQTFNQMLNSGDYRQLNFSNKDIVMLKHTNLLKTIQRKTKNINVKTYNLHLLQKQNDIKLKKQKAANKTVNRQIKKLESKELQNYKLEKFTRKKEDFVYKKPTKNLISLNDIINMLSDLKYKFLTDILSQFEIISFIHRIFQILFSTVTLDFNSIFKFFIYS